MATSTNSREFLIFICVLTLLVVRSEARLVPMLLFSTKDKVMNSKFGLREVINDVRNSEWLRKRALLGGKPERVSPGGPDAQHH